MLFALNPADRRCLTCGERKPLTEFYVAKEARDGRSSHCRICTRAKTAAWRKANPEQFRALRASWAEKNKDRVKATKENARMRRKYGITFKGYQEFLARQDGRCAICGGCEPGGKTGARFAVDHHHASGAVRGLLCMCCNTGIGHFRDSPELLRNAIAYLGRATAIGEPT